jgi:hypothetical protein
MKIRKKKSLTKIEKVDLKFLLITDQTRMNAIQLCVERVACGWHKCKKNSKEYFFVYFSIMA